MIDKFISIKTNNDNLYSKFKSTQENLFNAEIEKSEKEIDIKIISDVNVNIFSSFVNNYLKTK